MKSNNNTTFIIVVGLFILCTFVYISIINVPNNSSNSFFIKNSDTTSSEIKNIEFNNGKLYIETSGKSNEVCVKQTKSIPNQKNICWQNIKNNKVELSIFEDKLYYIWVKNINNNISDVTIYNTNNRYSK